MVVIEAGSNFRSNSWRSQFSSKEEEKSMIQALFISVFVSFDSFSHRTLPHVLLANVNQVHLKVSLLHKIILSANIIACI